MGSVLGSGRTAGGDAESRRSTSSLSRRSTSSFDGSLAIGVDGGFGSGIRPQESSFSYRPQPRPATTKVPSANHHSPLNAKMIVNIMPARSEEHTSELQ